jgi:hypothetical protein
VDRELSHAYPPLAAKAVSIATDYVALHPDRQCKWIGVWRSDEEQIELYAEGRTKPGPGATEANPMGRVVTWDDGVIKKSHHQGTDPKGNPCSMAVDFGVFVGVTYITDDDYYKDFKSLADKYGLASGWDFPPGDTDPPHVQVIGEPDFSYLNMPPTSDSTAVES